MKSNRKTESLKLLTLWHKKQVISRQHSPGCCLVYSVFHGEENQCLILPQQRCKVRSNQSHLDQVKYSSICLFTPGEKRLNFFLLPGNSSVFLIFLIFTATVLQGSSRSIIGRMLRIKIKPLQERSFDGLSGSKNMSIKNWGVDC